MKYNLLSMLILDVQDKRYDELQQIYETLNFRDNDKLVEKLSHERNISAFFTENIYYDMIQVISDHLASYGELFEVFETLYSGRYSGVRKVIEDLKIQYEKFGQINSAKKMKFSGKEAKLFYYYIYKTEAFQEPEKILKGFDYYRDEKLLKYLVEHRVLTQEQADECRHQGIENGLPQHRQIQPQTGNVPQGEGSGIGIGEGIVAHHAQRDQGEGDHPQDIGRGQEHRVILLHRRLPPSAHHTPQSRRSSHRTYRNIHSCA